MASRRTGAPSSWTVISTDSGGRPSSAARRASATGTRLVTMTPALVVLARNLVDNAVRYASPGTRVEVQVGLDGSRPVLQVDDAGPGIPPAERERVFDRFYRRGLGDESGTGLGLAIVRGVAQRHGAALALADSPLGGLRVTLRFGAAARPPQPSDAAARQA